MNFPKIEDTYYKGFTLKQIELGASCTELKWQCFEQDYDHIIFRFKLYVDEVLNIYDLVKKHKEHEAEQNQILAERFAWSAAFLSDDDDEEDETVERDTYGFRDSDNEKP